MKTFSQFMVEVYDILNEIDLSREWELRKREELNKKGKVARAQLGRTYPNRPDSKNLSRASQWKDLQKQVDVNSNMDKIRKGLESANRNPKLNPSSSNTSTTPTQAAKSNIDKVMNNPVVRTSRNVASLLAPPALALKTVLGTDNQQAASGEFKRRYGARPGEMRGLEPSLTRQSRVISDAGGKGGKVTTYKDYKATIGGKEGTSTRVGGGQRLLNVGAKELGKNPKPQGFNLIRPNTWFGTPTAGKSYGATLGGHKGTVTYNNKGERSFQALVKPRR